MNEEVKKALIKKLTRTQLFTLCVLGLFLFTLIVLMLCLLSPSSLTTFFGIF